MLIGEKVTLRAITREDLPRLCQFQNDLEVELASGGDPPAPHAIERIEAQFNANLERPATEVMQFAIEADGRCIGQCALFNVDQTAHTVETGIIIGDKAYWGKQYGREAVSLLLRYAFQYRNFHKVYLRTNGTNERAIRAYRACGFVEEGRLRQHLFSDGRYIDQVWMGILRHEWEAPAEANDPKPEL